MHKWYNKNLKLIIDITTHCNAKCPQCNRTDHSSSGLKKISDLPLVHWTLPEVKLAYAEDQLDNIINIHMSPTWGDPMMNPYIYEITDYLLSAISPSASISICTNGSMRDEEFWWNFGALAHKYRKDKKQLRVCFDIDGITQEMHSKYRRNTNLQKILDNMSAFSDNARSITTSQSIIFKHNQDYIKEIGNLAKKYGSQHHTNVKSDRFLLDENGSLQPFIFLNENGEEEKLEWADKDFDNPYLAHYKEKIDIDEKVICKWASDNVLNINFDGQVWPCCYFGCQDYTQYERSKEYFYKNEIVQRYNLMRFDNNIKFTPLKKIIENSWFNGQLQESIENNPIRVCTKHCSTRVRSFKKQQVRSVH